MGPSEGFERTETPSNKHFSQVERKIPMFEDTCATKKKDESNFKLHSDTGKSQTNPEGSYAIRDNTSPVMDHNGEQKFASRPVRRQDM